MKVCSICPVNGVFFNRHLQNYIFFLDLPNICPSYPVSLASVGLQQTALLNINLEGKKSTSLWFTTYLALRLNHLEAPRLSAYLHVLSARGETQTLLNEIT